MSHLSAEPVNLITQVFTLISCSYLLYQLLKPLKLPTVMAELLTGILLDPSCFGLLFSSQQAWLFPSTPNSSLAGLAQIGSLLLLILAGLEIEREKIHGSRIFVISLGGIIIPFLLGFITAPYLMATNTNQEKLIFSLFMGVSMSISAVSVMAKMFLDMNIINSTIAQFSLLAAMSDDVMGWILLSLVTSMITLKNFDIYDFSYNCSVNLLFVALILYFGPRFTAYIFRFSSQKLVICMILCTMMSSFAIYLKIEPILGAFLTAIVLPVEVKSEIKIYLVKLLSAVFAPIFFAMAGLKVDLTYLSSWDSIKSTLVILAIACVGKIVGVYLGGRLVSLRHSESIAMAWAMNTRGSQEIIIATLGLKLNIISQSIYASIILMSIATNLIAAPMIQKYVVKELRLPIVEAEKLNISK